MSSDHRILFVGEYAGVIGGIERCMIAFSTLLRARTGHPVDALYLHDAPERDRFCASFDRVIPASDFAAHAGDYSLIVIHKIRDVRLLQALRNDGGKLVLFVHDHEYYCPARSYYYPVTRANCHRKYSPLICAICASLRRKSSAVEPFLVFPDLWKLVSSLDAFLVISDFMKENLCKNGIHASKIHKIVPEILCPDVPDNLGHPNPNEPPHLVTAGQLIRGKGVDLLLDAVSEIRTPFVLDILGRGEEEKRLCAHPAVAAGNVIFHGWVEQAAPFLLKATASVLPWRWQEPFGLVGPEAMAAGVPLIAFDLGGVREYVEHGRNGFLVPPGDLHALASNIETLLLNPDSARTMGRRARETVAARYSTEMAWRSWAEALGDCL